LAQLLRFSCSGSCLHQVRCTASRDGAKGLRNSLGGLSYAKWRRGTSAYLSDAGRAGKANSVFYRQCQTYWTPGTSDMAVEARLDQIRRAADRVRNHTGEAVMQCLINNQAPGLCFYAGQYQQVASMVIDTQLLLITEPDKSGADIRRTLAILG